MRAFIIHNLCFPIRSLGFGRRMSSNTLSRNSVVPGSKKNCQALLSLFLYNLNSILVVSLVYFTPKELSCSGQCEEIVAVFFSKLEAFLFYLHLKKSVVPCSVTPFTKLHGGLFYLLSAQLMGTSVLNFNRFQSNKSIVRSDHCVSCDVNNYQRFRPN